MQGQTSGSKSHDTERALANTTQSAHPLRAKWAAAGRLAAETTEAAVAKAAAVERMLAEARNA